MALISRVRTIDLIQLNPQLFDLLIHCHIITLLAIVERQIVGTHIKTSHTPLLGHITDRSGEELKDLLGQEDVTVRLER